MTATVRTELGSWYEPLFILTVVIGVVSVLLIATFAASAAFGTKKPEPVPIVEDAAE